MRTRRTTERLECLYCDHVSQRIGEAKRHRKEAHPPETRHFVCEVCGQEFVGTWSLNAYNRHMKFHATDIGERFFSHVHMTSECWLWTAATDTNGYGVFTIQEKPYSAHRTAYLNIVGPIPVETPHLDHLCMVTRCVNPAHLEPVTQEENMRRAHAALRVNCEVCGKSFMPGALAGHMERKHALVVCDTHTTERREGGS